MTDSTRPADDVWTVQRILLWTADFLKQKGVESARLEAELLLAHARNCQRIRLYTDFEVPLTDEERGRMREMVKRRAAREPLAYITGHREFYGREFSVGAGVLIPRPDTETLVDVCLDRISGDRPSRVCEVGFGSGCICITLARQRKHVIVDASDTSPQAMEFATKNVTTHEVQDRVRLHAGSLFEPFLKEGRQFDGIVSNPPYIRDDEMSGLEPEVVQHEPNQALAAGEDGLDVVRQLLTTAAGVLKPGGWIALEIDPGQSATVERLMTQNGFVDERVHKDLSGSDRVVSAVLPQSL